MSNEELVAAIQQGDMELMESLWERVRRLVHTFAYRYYMATQGRGGVAVEDLEQIGYLAMMDAIPRYNPGEAAFSTYLVQYLRKHFQEASGRLYKDAKGRLMPKDALDTAISLNVTVDDDEETELMEITTDPAAGLESTEDVIWREQLRGVIADVLQELPEEQAEAIRCRYWRKLTYDKTADWLGCDVGSARAAENKGLRALRQAKHRRRLLPFYDFNYYGGTSLGAFKRTGMSIQERYLERKEQLDSSRFV